MVFTIYGHGDHPEFQIMTHFSLILYNNYINAKYEISLKLAKKFHRKCHLNFFMYGSHGNQKLPCNFHKDFIYVIKILSLIFLRKISFIAQRFLCIGNFASFFPISPHQLKAYL